MAKPSRPQNRRTDKPTPLADCPGPEEFQPQTMEQAADAAGDDEPVTDDRPGNELPPPHWDSIVDCIDAIDRHVLTTHGLTRDKEFLQKIAAFLRRTQHW